MAGLEIKPKQFENPGAAACVLEGSVKKVEAKKLSTSNDHGAVDTFTSDSKVDKEEPKESVSFKQACKSFLNGLISPVTTLLKSPLAWALLIGGGLLAAVVPVTVPIMFAVGLIASSGYLAKGITNAIIAGVNSDGKRFANAFENIGTGTIGILLARASFGRAARNAYDAWRRAAFPFVLPCRRGSNFYELCSLFATKDGWKVIGTSFTYRKSNFGCKGINKSLRVIKVSLQDLTSSSGWGDWFRNCRQLIGMFLPTLNQPLGFSRCEQVF